MENVVATQYCNIQDDAGMHGGKIGTIGTGTEIVIDASKMHEGWVPIVAPAGLGPTWKKTGKQGWIEKAHTTPVVQGMRKYILEIPDTGDPTIKRIG